MEQAIATLDRIHPLPAVLSNHLRTLLKKKTYLKREHLLHEGQTCKNIWFIEKGIVGCFYEKSDKMLCSWFMKELDVVTSVTSFFQQFPSPEDIIALDDTMTWTITYAQLEQVYAGFPEFNYHGRVLTQHYYILAELRMRAFHNQPPLVKYQYLLEHFPEIPQRVSVKDMAKFIGMHPDVLSRVRGKI